MSRRALLIACSQYSDAKLLPLGGTLADTRDLRAVLTDPEISEFEVEVLENPSSLEFSHAIERFYASCKSGDVAFVYCSGHGVKSSTSGGLYLAASNTDTSYLASTAVSARFIQEQIENCRAKQKVLVLDCCFAGAFLRGARHRGSTAVPLADSFPGGKGTVYIASSGATQYSWEGDHIDGEPSPSHFTQCLVEGLRTGAADANGDGLVGVRELFDYVADELSECTRDQRPEFSSQELVEIYLTKAPAKALEIPEAVTAPAEPVPASVEQKPLLPKVEPEITPAIEPKQVLPEEPKPVPASAPAVNTRFDRVVTGAALLAVFSAALFDVSVSFHNPSSDSLDRVRQWGVCPWPNPMRSHGRQGFAPKGATCLSSHLEPMFADPLGAR